MRLNEQDYNQYMRIHPAFLYFIAKRKGWSPARTLKDFIAGSDAQLKLKCREEWLKNKALLDEFIRENPAKLSQEDLDLASEFRHAVHGKFFIYKYLKEHAIFMQDNYAYGVLALNDPFEYVIGYELPTMVEAVLLPFKGKIVYDGMLMGYGIYFGGGIKSGLNDTYKAAKAKFGIITSLPFGGDTAWSGKLLEEELDYFMSTKANREEFEEKIEELLRKHPKLLPQYHQLKGKADASFYKRNFKNLGLGKAWYAILEGNLVSSALTGEALEKTLAGLVPKEKRGWVYVFRM